LPTSVEPSSTEASMSSTSIQPSSTEGLFYEEPPHYPQMLSSLLRSASSLVTSVKPSSTEGLFYEEPLQ
jgi:hypothetical protein